MCTVGGKSCSNSNDSLLNSYSIYYNGFVLTFLRNRATLLNYMVTGHGTPPLEQHPPQEYGHSTKPSEGNGCVYRRFNKFEKATVILVSSSCISVRLSVHPHGTTSHPTDGFSQNLTSECFSKMCRENSGFIKV